MTRKKVKYNQNELLDAHVHCYENKEAIKSSKKASCFHCQHVFAANMIKKYITQDSCAVCPYCGFDTVLGDKSGLPVEDKVFLQQMWQWWFGEW